MLLLQVVEEAEKALMEADPTIVCYDLPFTEYNPEYAPLRSKAWLALFFYVVALPASIFLPFLYHLKTKSLCNPRSWLEPSFRCIFQK